MRADELTASAGAGAPDATATGKQHFEVLDGLRGTAALLVVLFHIQGITVGFLGDKVVLHHAPLAVDFFFALSGFVIGYAYDDRWPRMTVRHFLALRLIRLHPLAVLGVTLGLASYLLDPFAGGAQAAPLKAVMTAFALGLLLLPSRPLPNRWEDTHPLDGPCWTLLQEYIGNIAYALALRRLSARALGLVAVLAAVALVASGLALGTLDRGWGWDKLWMAPVRLAYPFVIGLWLYRVRHRLPRVRLGLLPLSLVLIVAFAMPTLPDAHGIRWNGLYEAACVVLLFPAIVLLGAHSDAGAGMIGLCKASGRISYPLYITHFPFAYAWMNYVATAHPSTGASWVIGTALLAFVLLVAWVAFTFYDVPIRARLRRRIGA
ncbi:acyltransferase family protein [Sphingomonas nostoxanthinifaciens]|uniref:acyltransferase family protein n=1 Tax=Sphingomonas nostoxanthinifaciens TaxID=2872652 RepID=UPI001CC20CA8|nr:acyltransferase [Sphingomonas nostoxanthinifaciens]UAK23540.1 acyltransferase [Sphingomonas nostoxanthinifaciens]